MKFKNSEINLVNCVDCLENKFKKEMRGFCEEIY